MFVAQFKYGQANLVSVGIKKETKARYYVDEKPTVILGSNFIYSTFVAKHDARHQIFDTEHKAFVYLASQIESGICARQRQIGKLIVDLQYLHALMDGEVRDA